MKKSMRMVSVMMSAVMAMSAMSALAAGASAADFHGPAHNPKSSYTESYDSLSRTSIPVWVRTTGINGRLSNVSVTMDYEFVAKADSSAVKTIKAKHPEYFVTVPDIDGNVVVHVNEKHTYTSNTKKDEAIRFDVPANTDLSGMTITLGYHDFYTGDHEFCKCDLADSHINGQPDQIIIDLEGDSYFINYNVYGKVVAGGNMLCSQKV